MMELMGRDKEESERVVVLMFDEMKVTKIYEYDEKDDEILGPHNYLQVVMARGLFSSWKQPIYINFDTQISKSILLNMIEELYLRKFVVAAIVCDCGGGNRGLWTHLGISKDHVYFQHPNTNDNIYM